MQMNFLPDSEVSPVLLLEEWRQRLETPLSERETQAAIPMFYFQRHQTAGCILMWKKLMTLWKTSPPRPGACGSRDPYQFSLCPRWDCQAPLDLSKFVVQALQTVSTELEMQC